MPLPTVAQIEEQDPRYLRFRRQILAVSAAWAAVTVLVTASLGLAGLAVGLIGWGALAVVTALWTFHRLQIEQVRHYRQLEALFSLHALIKINQPLPPTRLWAASPDFLLLAVELVRQTDPRFVLELGSGVSTLVCAYALRDSSGQLISMDHDAGFGQATVGYLRSHGLDNVAKVVCAPLRQIRVGAQVWRWYETNIIETLPPVDLLIVDGPPATTQPLARYPALPLLFDRLSAGALILVDDFARSDDAATVSKWLQEYDLVVVRTVPTEKGAVILRKTDSAG